MDLLSETDRLVIKQLEELFMEVDISADRLKEVTGIHCPEGCGICCLEAKVETTSIEMMPIAAYLWEKGEAEEWLEKIDNAPDPGSCVFFKSEAANPEKGRCLVYSLRPLICRLFGFFTIRDKNGRYVYGGCKVIKKHYPEAHERSVKLIFEGYHPSSITDYSIRIISMGTGLSRKLIPINTAAKASLEKIGFELDYTRGEIV